MGDVLIPFVCGMVWLDLYLLGGRKGAEIVPDRKKVVKSSFDSLSGLVLAGFVVTEALICVHVPRYGECTSVTSLFARTAVPCSLSCVSFFLCPHRFSSRICPPPSLPLPTTPFPGNESTTRVRFVAALPLSTAPQRPVWR